VLFYRQPWNHYYYQLLDGAIPPTDEPWTPTTAIKTVIDQFVQAPIFTVLIFTFLGFLEGKNAEAIKQQLEDDYKDTMIANCKYAVSIKNKNVETLLACW
jgi:peroxisomal membrane protein 2